MYSKNNQKAKPCVELARKLLRSANQGEEYMKTVLAKGAPWYDIPKPKEEAVKKKRAKPPQIDANFKKWLIKEGYVNDRRG